MTLRERAADAMRLKDAELRGVVGAPSWEQLAVADQGRWLAVHDAGVEARVAAIASRQEKLPAASLRVVSDRTGGVVRVRGCVVEVCGEPLAEIATVDCQVIANADSSYHALLVVTTPLRELGDVQSWTPERSGD